jgi:UDP-N-acetylmuramoylalanine--D-glutamate ligase
MHIDQQSFDGKTVLIFGFGTNGGGLGTLHFLLSTQAERIIVTDQKTLADFTAAGMILPADPRIVWRLGEHVAEDFTAADIVIKNPAIKWDHPLLLAAEQSGASILMDSTIFMALCPAPVIGITGSKGKTTTASLVAHILETAGHMVVRVGISQTGVLSELPKVTSQSVVVFELSSWRLSGLKNISERPRISILTNLYPDHLNYYPSITEYAQDKLMITDQQTQDDFFILPEESKWASYYQKHTQAQVKTFGTSPVAAAWQDAENLWLRPNIPGTGPRLITSKDTTLIAGEHLFSNMLAAALVAECFGVDLHDIQTALHTFAGVPHRFELVRELRGVRYINDTAATIPSAALASVQSVQGPVILLAGGSDKNLPLDELLSAIATTKHTLLFQGTSTDKILEELSPELKDRCTVVTSMHEAITKAATLAENGDTVLLAPGAASFGMFRNEFDRGEQFVESVLALPTEV